MKQDPNEWYARSLRLDGMRNTFSKPNPTGLTSITEQRNGKRKGGRFTEKLISSFARWRANYQTIHLNRIKMRPLPSTVICFNSNQRNFSSSFPILFLFISSISVLQWLSLFFPLHLNYLSILKFLIFQHDLRFGIAVLVNSSTRSYVNNSTIGIPVRSNDIDISNVFIHYCAISNI